MNENKTPGSDQLFTVGQWRVNPALNTLASSDETVSIEPKVMDLLVLLASAPGQVIARADIDSALWPDVIVGEDTLARTVSKLRRALSDQASSPAYVQTIPKRGYRLIAPVSLEQSSKASEAAKTKSDFFTEPRRSALAALSILASVSLAYFLMSPRSQTSEDRTPDRASANAIAIDATERGNDLYMRFTRADNEAAIVLFERAIASDSTYAPAQAGLANALVQRTIRWQSPPGAPPSASSLSDALTRGITLEGEAASVLERAVDLGARAVRSNPNDADAYKALGFAYSAQGDFVNARESYREAVAISADSWEAMINLGELAAFHGDKKIAREWYEKAFVAMDRLYKDEPQRIGPWRAPLGVTIGDAYADTGDLASAEIWYRRVLDQTPLDPQATAKLANLLRDLGDHVEANNLCQNLSNRVGPKTECMTD